MCNFFDLIWPHVGKFYDDKNLKSDLKEIEQITWEKGSAAIYLEEARRLRDTETSRKNSADTKSQIYLAALLAIIPILVSLTEPDGVMGKLDYSQWYVVIGFFSFLLGIVYGIGAFISSFRALSVRAYNRIDVDSFLKKTENAPEEQLAKDILKSVRLDREIVNNKISHVIVAHELLFRMALSIVFALMVIAVVPKVIEILSLFKMAICF